MILRGVFFSQVLEMETNISIVAPDTLSEQPLKVVYLLHGLCGRSGDWIDYTMLPSYAKQYSALFVMPEVARSFYANMQYGSNYLEYITNELPAIVSSHFRVSPSSCNTAIIGASMGGYGALKAALTKPASYGFCGAFSSPCLMLKDDLAYTQGAQRFKEVFGERLYKDFQAAFGENIDWHPSEDVVELAKACHASAAPKLYLACGNNDMFLSDNKRFYSILQDLGHNPTFNEWPGNHDWPFFDQALKHALEQFFSGGE